ncbi:hypothetical protein [Rheinheimera sp.]|uniref:hypothetical protein n=1 Tax=Rheinheimera sp. TaxID=1869214 RepID=UPI00307E0ED1
MKLYDEPLLQLIFERQLVEIANRTLHHYVGGEYAVCGDTEFNFNLASYIAQRVRITDIISSHQLLSRLKRFHERGMLAYVGRPYQFFFPTEQARQAFRFARQFYLNQGVPESNGNGPISAKVGNIAALREDCLQALRERFPLVSYDQVYGLAKHKAMKEKAAA